MRALVLACVLLVASVSGECSKAGKYDADAGSSVVVPAVTGAGAGASTDPDCNTTAKSELGEAGPVDAELSASKVAAIKAETLKVLEENKGLHVSKSTVLCSTIDEDVRALAIEKGECTEDAASLSPAAQANATASKTNATGPQKVAAKLAAAKERLAKAEEDGSDEALAEARYEMEESQKVKDQTPTPCAEGDSLCEAVQSMSKQANASIEAKGGANATTDEDDDEANATTVAPKKKSAGASVSVLKQISALLNGAGADSVVNMVAPAGNTSKPDPVRDAMRIAMSALSAAAKDDKNEAARVHSEHESVLNATIQAIKQSTIANATIAKDKKKEAAANLSKALEEGDEEAIAEAQKRANKTANGTDPDVPDVLKFVALKPHDKIKIKGANDTKHVRDVVSVEREAKVTISMDIDFVNANKKKFTDAFEIDVAASADCLAENVHVTSIAAGSVVVAFKIDGVTDPADRVTDSDGSNKLAKRGMKQLTDLNGKTIEVSAAKNLPKAPVKVNMPEKAVRNLLAANKSLANSSAFRKVVEQLTGIHINKHENHVQQVVNILQSANLPVDDISVIRKIITAAASSGDHTASAVSSTIEEIIMENQKPKATDLLTQDDMILRSDNTEAALKAQAVVAAITNEAMLLSEEKADEEESISEGMLSEFFVRYFAKTNCSEYKEKLDAVKSALVNAVDTEPENIKIIALNNQIPRNYEAVDTDKPDSCRVMVEVLMVNGDRAEDNLRYLLSEDSDVLAPLEADSATVMIKGVAPAGELEATQSAVEMFTGYTKEDQTVKKVWEPKKKQSAHSVLANVGVVTPLSRVLGLTMLSVKNASAAAHAELHGLSHAEILGVLTNTSHANVSKAFTAMMAKHADKSSAATVKDTAEEEADKSKDRNVTRDALKALAKRITNQAGNALGGDREVVDHIGNKTVILTAPAVKLSDDQANANKAAEKPKAKAGPGSKASLTIEMDFNWVNRHRVSFDKAFAGDIARSCSLASGTTVANDQVSIIEVHPGSTVVLFSVSGQPNVAGLLNETKLDLTDLTAMNGGVAINATVVDLGSTEEEEEEDDEVSVPPATTAAATDAAVSGGVAGAMALLNAPNTAGGVESARRQQNDIKAAKKLAKRANKTGGIKKALSPEAVSKLPLVKAVDARLDAIIMKDTDALQSVKAKMDIPAVAANEGAIATLQKLLEARKVKVEADYMAKSIVRRFATGANYSLETLFRMPAREAAYDSGDDAMASLKGVISGEITICTVMQKLVRSGEYGVGVASRSKAIVRAGLQLFEKVYQGYLGSLKVEPEEPVDHQEGDSLIASDAIKRIKACKRNNCTYLQMYAVLRNVGQNFTGKTYTILNGTRADNSSFGACKGDRKKNQKAIAKAKAAAAAAQDPADLEAALDANKTDASYEGDATKYASILDASAQSETSGLPDRLRAAIRFIVGASNGSNASLVDNHTDSAHIVREAPAFSPAIAHLIGKVERTDPNVVMMAGQRAVAVRSGNEGLQAATKDRQDAAEDVDELEKQYAKKDRQDNLDLDTMASLDKAYDDQTSAPAMAKGTVSVDVDFMWASENKDEFELAFKTDIAACMNITSYNVTLLGVKPGSVIVDFAVTAIGHKDLSLYMRRVKFAALSTLMSAPVSLNFFKEETTSLTAPTKRPFINGTSAGSYTLPEDVSSPEDLALAGSVDEAAAPGDAKGPRPMNYTNNTGELRAIRAAENAAKNTPSKSLRVRLLEGIREVIAKSDDKDTLVQMNAVDKKISKQLSKQRAAEEGVDADVLKNVDSLDAKAEALKKSAAVAASKADEYAKDGTAAWLVDDAKGMADIAQNKSAEAFVAADKARVEMTAFKPKQLGLSLSNITKMLSRNGTFVEDAGKRDSSKMVKDAQKRAVAEALGDLDAGDVTLASLLKRVSASKDAEVADAARDIIDVQNVVAKKPAEADCVGKECELKKENSELMQRLAVAKADQDAKDVRETGENNVLAPGGTLGGNGIDALSKPTSSQQVCTQKCLGEKCFPSWNVQDEAQVAEAKSCISCSAKCKPECAKTVTSEERNAMCNMNCNTRCCPSEELKGKRDDWKAQESCRGICTTQCTSA